MRKLAVTVAMLFVSPMVFADDIDSAINMEETAYEGNLEHELDKPQANNTNNHLYTPEHQDQEANANQAEFMAPPPRIIDDKPFTPETSKASGHASRSIELVKPGNHNYRSKNAAKNTGVTITFADEDHLEKKRQLKEKELLKKFYQIEAKKKQKKAAIKKSLSKKKLARKSQQKFKRISKR